MKLIDFILPVNSNIFCITDDHEGAILRDTKGWNKMTDMVESEYDGVSDNYVVHHGDPCEAIQIDDPRYDGITTDGAIYSQLQQCHRNMEAIKHRTIVMLEGNHPLKLWRFFGPGKPGFTQVLAEEKLGINYGTWACVISYRTKEGKFLFSQYAIHGAGRAIGSVADDPKRRISNERLALKRRLQHKFGSALVMTCGHWHRLLYCEPESELYIEAKGGKMLQKFTGPKKREGYIHPDYRHYACCGSFLKTYGEDVSSYSEIAGYNPVILGFIVIKIRDGKIQTLDEVII